MNQTIWGEDFEENILNVIKVDLSASVQNLGAQFHSRISTIHRILQDKKLHTCYLQKVHAGLHTNFPRRMEYQSGF